MSDDPIPKPLTTTSPSVMPATTRGCSFSLISHRSIDHGSAFAARCRPALGVSSPASCIRMSASAWSRDVSWMGAVLSACHHVHLRPGRPAPPLGPATKSGLMADESPALNAAPSVHRHQRPWPGSNATPRAAQSRTPTALHAPHHLAPTHRTDTPTHPPAREPGVPFRKSRAAALRRSS
jgi:hypothetical protein